MLRRLRSPTSLLILLLAALSVAGFVRLFELRFAAGDVYPPYSSLRADPLGTKVLHDALRDTSDFEVSRNFLPVDKIATPGETTIFYTGARFDFWPYDEVDQLDGLAKNGARVIVTFLPEANQKAVRKLIHGAAKKKNAPAKPLRGKDKEEETPSDMPFSDVAKQWGFSLARFKSQSSRPVTPKLTAAAMQPDIEPALSWHTAIYFSDPQPVWRILYRAGGQPVVMERELGRGCIVIATDSYFLSNEAMRAERAPRLLAWLLGSRSRVVFDETHLGVEEKPGISTLVRKYRLEGLLGAIAVLAGLFVWESSSPFLPPRADAVDLQTVIGKDSAAGFVSLLRRGIPPSRLIRVCMDEWHKSPGNRSPNWSATLARIEALVAQTGRGPLEVYRAISQTLTEKK
jgi:hypothetical protein